MNVVTPFFIYTPFIVLPALLYGHSLAESKIRNGLMLLM